MAKAISSHTKQRAKELFCLDALRAGEIAALTGISAAVIRRWAEREGWEAEREAVAAHEAEIRINLVKARAYALRKLLDWEGDKETSLALSAVDKLERIALRLATHRLGRGKNLGNKDAEVTAPTQKIAKDTQLPENMSDSERIALLESAVNRQIAHLLQNPVPDMASRVRDIKSGLDALAALKGKDSGASIKVSFDE